MKDSFPRMHTVTGSTACLVGKRIVVTPGRQVPGLEDLFCEGIQTLETGYTNHHL